MKKSIRIGQLSPSQASARGAHLSGRMKTEFYGATDQIYSRWTCPWHRLRTLATGTCSVVALILGAFLSPAAPIASLSVTHNSGGQAVVNGELFVWSGMAPGGVRGTTLEIYSPGSDTWTNGAPAPSGRELLTAFALNGRIYSVCGEGPNAANFSSTVYRYDPASNAWTNLNNFPQPGWEKMAAVVNGTAYVFGGRQGYGQTYGDVYKYNETNDTWTAMTPMPVPIMGSAVAVYQGKVYVFGGDYKPSEPVNIFTSVLQIFDPVANSWTTQAIPWATTNFYCEAAAVGDYAYIFGVVPGNTNLYRYHFDSGQWSQQPYTPPYTDGCANYTAPVIGGYAHFANVLTNGVASTIAYKVNLEMYVPDWPEITAQPQSQIGYWGRSVTFTVAAAGDSPLSYQWQKNGTNIVGATSSTLTLNNLQPGDAGTYDVVVSNDFGSTTSPAAVLSFSVAPVSIAAYAGVMIDGVVGQTYQIQYTTNLKQTNSWVALTNIMLSTDPQVWIDMNSPSQPQRFYRVAIP